MKNTKQILAIIGIILLVVLYLSTLVFALLGKNFFPIFMASLVSTIMLPVIIWLYTMLHKNLKKKNKKEA